MKKCSDLIEKQICDQQTQNLRLQGLQLVGCARFGDFSFFGGPFTTPNILTTKQHILI